MADLWHYIDVGLKVEVANTDSYDFCDEYPNSFWIASVLRVEGKFSLFNVDFLIASDLCNVTFYDRIQSSSQIRRFYR